MPRLLKSDTKNSNYHIKKNILKPTTSRIHICHQDNLNYSSFMPNFKKFRAGCKMRSTNINND